jgi:Ca2+-binding EF-hand superfamily protein
VDEVGPVETILVDPPDWHIGQDSLGDDELYLRMIREPLDCFTDEQLAAFKREFDWHDTNKNEFLSQAEFEEALRNLGFVPTQNDLAAMFRELGAREETGDEPLEIDIKVLYYYTRGADKTEDLIRALLVFDAGRTGKITIDNVKAILGRLWNQFPQERIDDLIQRLRKGDSNEIEYAEMIRLLPGGEILLFLTRCYQPK